MKNNIDLSLVLEEDMLNELRKRYDGFLFVTIVSKTKDIFLSPSLKVKSSAENFFPLCKTSFPFFRFFNKGPCGNPDFFNLFLSILTCPFLTKTYAFHGVPCFIFSLSI